MGNIKLGNRILLMNSNAERLENGSTLVKIPIITSKTKRVEQTVFVLNDPFFECKELGKGVNKTSGQPELLLEVNNTKGSYDTIVAFSNYRFYDTNYNEMVSFIAHAHDLEGNIYNSILSSGAASAEEVLDSLILSKSIVSNGSVYKLVFMEEFNAKDLGILGVVK